MMNRARLRAGLSTAAVIGALVLFCMVFFVWIPNHKDRRELRKDPLGYISEHFQQVSLEDAMAIATEKEAAPAIEFEPRNYRDLSDITKMEDELWQTLHSRRTGHIVFDPYALHFPNLDLTIYWFMKGETGAVKIFDRKRGATFEYIEFWRVHQNGHAEIIGHRLRYTINGQTFDQKDLTANGHTSEVVNMITDHLQYATNTLAVEIASNTAKRERGLQQRWHEAHQSPD